MNTSQAYETLKGIVDEESLIDYVIIETLGGNLDWVGFSGSWDSPYYPYHVVYNGNNQRMWYYTGADDGQFGHDGKFRWMLYDTDKSWGYRNGGEYNDPTYNTIQTALNDNLFFFNKLMQNDVFRAKFVSRYREALTTWLTLDKMQAAVDETSGDINEAIVEQQKRWPYSLTHDAWLTEVQGIKDWMATRVNPNGAFVNAINSYMPSGQTSNIIAYVGDESTLPTDVNWTNLDAFQNAKPFDRVQLIGTASGSDLLVTANVDVIPRNTTYFIDAGTSGWSPLGNGTLFRAGNTNDHWGANLTGSNDYDRIKSKLAQDGHDLLNGVSDQLFDGNWGVEKAGILFPVSRDNGPDAERLMTGYVGYGADPNATDFIEYKLSLPAGDYKITTGHYCWWSLMYNDQGQPAGGYPRTMQVLFNDLAVTDPFTFENFGDNGIKHDIPYTQVAAGILSIKINTTAGDGATISFIGVEDVTDAKWYNISYVDWDNTILKTQRTRDGLPEVVPPQDPARPGYKFTGWVADTENSTADNKIMKATYEELPDAPVEILTATYHGVIYAGEVPNLPTSADVKMMKGATEQRAINWNTAPLTGAKAFETVVLTGTPEGNADLSMTAIIEVIPQNLIYFIDAGTIGEYHPTDGRTVSTGYSTFIQSAGYYNNGVYYIDGPMLKGSETYDLIKAKLLKEGKQIYNEVSDKMFGNDRWGLTEDAYQFPVVHPEAVNRKLATGLVGWDDRSDPGYENRVKYIEYHLWLPAGQYEITTGHYCWWNLMVDENNVPFGGFPRTMQIEFNDIPMGDPFTFSHLGDNKVATNSYTQAADGDLSIKVQALDGTDGATLSFIGVKFMSEDGITSISGSHDLHIAAYVGEPETLPKTIDVLYRSGKTEPANIVWDNLTDFTQAKAYDAVKLTGAVEGHPELKLSATVEVIPRGLMYFIDAAAFTGADDKASGRFIVDPNNVDGNGMYGFKSGGTYSSPAFDAVSSRLQSEGAPLLNNASDQFYNGSNGWGLNPDTYQFAVDMVNMPLDKKFTTGYVGYDNIANYSDKPKYLEYSLYLPKGKYEITTGHYDWWGAYGGHPRAMNILFNDVKVDGPIEFGTFMDQAIVTNTYTQDADGILNIKVWSVDADPFHDGATLTFIGVRKDQTKPILYGDVNDDGVVDGHDVMILTRWYAEWPGYSIDELNADVNNDGIVNGVDVMILTRYYAEWPGYEKLPYVSANTSQQVPSFMTLLKSGIPANSAPTIRVSDVEGKVGDIVEAAISLENNPGIVAMQIQLNYDKSVLEIVGVENTGALSGDNFPPQWVPGFNYPSPLTLDWNDGLAPKNNTADGNIVKVRFRALAAENSEISVTTAGIFNYNLGVVPFNVKSGLFSSRTITLVNNPNKDVLSAYPNPVKRGHILKVEGVAAGKLIEVYNSNGMRVYHTIVTESPASLNLNVPEGIYILRADNKEIKIVIN